MCVAPPKGEGEDSCVFVYVEKRLRLPPRRGEVTHMCAWMWESVSGSPRAEGRGDMCVCGCGKAFTAPSVGGERTSVLWNGVLVSPS